VFILTVVARLVVLFSPRPFSLVVALNVAKRPKRLDPGISIPSLDLSLSFYSTQLSKSNDYFRKISLSKHQIKPTMTRTFPHGVRIGHAAAKQHSNSKRSNCANFYTSPTAGQVVNTTSPAVFSWDPSLNCFTPAPKNVDIYLYAPNQNNSLIQAFKGADYKQGTYSVSCFFTVSRALLLTLHSP
jgi:hypothetical protein